MGFEKGNKFGKGRPKGSANKSKVVYIKNVYEDLIGSFKSGNSYVYYHINTENNEIFYIGKGKNDRAWSFSGSDRNQLWLDYTLENTNYDVRIICSNLSDEEALAVESSLIKIKNPICNIMLNDIINIPT